MDKQKLLLHVTRIPIRWGDMDAMGHVNNTVYFRYAEQARVEWFEGMGYGVSPRQATPVIINASCTFLVPLTYPDTVEVRMFAGPPGRSSLPTFYEMRRGGDGRLCAEGSAKVVWMDPATGRSAPLPEALRGLFEGSGVPSPHVPEP
ncbi:MAG: acyl-CoA thioesterase [Betaproteobacteria bacterium]|nr:acyl-CoA thioesterase [Betaproteobacteria bacterium]